MLTIGEVASRTGLRASAIRYYEARGLLRQPLREGGKRIYPSSIVEQLAVIEVAKIVGFSLDEIRTLLTVGAGQPGDGWRQLIPARIAHVDAEIGRLAAMKALLTKLDGCTCSSFDDCGRAFIMAPLRHRSRQRLRPQRTIPKRRH